MKVNPFSGKVLLPAMLALLFVSCKKEVSKGSAEAQSLSNTEQVLVADGEQSRAAGRAVAQHAESELPLEQPGICLLQGKPRDLSGSRRRGRLRKTMLLLAHIGL